MMGLILLVLLIALLLGGLGFAVHALWIFAVVVLVVWVLGFALARESQRVATPAGTGGKPRFFALSVFRTRGSGRR